MINKIHAFFLRATLIVMGLITLALCIFALPNIWKGGSLEFPTASFFVVLIVIGMYITVIPFFIAIWQAWKLITYIKENKIFSNEAIKTLRKIKLSIITIAILYFSGVPLLLPIAEADDAPGLLLFGFAIACIPAVLALVLDTVQRIIESGRGLDLKF